MTKNIDNYKSPGNTIIVSSLALSDTIGDVFIPEQYREQSFFKVIELGLKFEHDDINIGDIVLINGKGGDRLDIQNGTYWVYNVKLVAAKIIDDEVIPFTNFVVLHQEEIDPVVQNGGILIPDSATSSSVVKHKVLRVGSTCVDLEIGDIALLDPDHCIPVKTISHNVYLTSEKVVIAIIG